MLGLDPVQESEVKKSKDRYVAGSKGGEGWIVVLVVVGGLIYLLSKGLEAVSYSHWPLPPTRID